MEILDRKKISLHQRKKLCQNSYKSFQTCLQIYKLSDVNNKGYFLNWREKSILKISNKRIFCKQHLNGDIGPVSIEKSREKNQCNENLMSKLNFHSGFTLLLIFLTFIMVSAIEPQFHCCHCSRIVLQWYSYTIIFCLNVSCRCTSSISRHKPKRWVHEIANKWLSSGFPVHILYLILLCSMITRSEKKYVYISYNVEQSTDETKFSWIM